MLFGEYNHYVFISYHLQVSDIKGVYIISTYYIYTLGDVVMECMLRY